VTEGLPCLSLLCRDHSDEKYKSEIDGRRKFEKLAARGNAVWDILKKEALAENWI
jgi:hypothetical protein